MLWIYIKLSLLLYACDNENDNSNENSSITVRSDMEWENGYRSIEMDKVSLHFPLSAFKASEFFPENWNGELQSEN